MSDQSNCYLSDPEYSHDDIEIVTSKRSFDGFFAIDTITLRHKRFAGDWTPGFTRELFERGEAVCVLLFDPGRDVVVLAEQFRIGALQDQRSPWLLELVAGMVEAGESYQQVAERETEEEAGCRFYRLIPICNYWVSPGGTSERVQLYCGLIDSTGVGGVHGLEQENEDIRLHVLPFEKAYGAIGSGEINNAATIMALQWLKIHHQQLCQPSSAGAPTVGR